MIKSQKQGKFHSKKLMSSTLVEVLVAVAICLIVFTMALNILIKSESENNTRLTLKAELAQERIISFIKETSNLESDTINIDGMVVSTEIISHDEFPGLYCLTCKVFTKNMKPLAVKQILLKKEHDKQ